MPVFHLRHGTARTIRVQVLAEWLGAVRDHVVARCYGAMPKSGYQVPYSYGGNEKAPLKLRESANTNFLLARDNRVKRHKVHPRNYPGCPPFRERAKRKRQPSSGEVTRALLLTYLLRRLAPTLVVAFRKAPTPDFRYLKRRSNHSATVAGRQWIMKKVLRTRGGAEEW